MGDAAQGHQYSRKDKSLGLLCDNFIAIYVRGGQDEICIDEVAETLSVERRRIYDIVNVLESVGVVLRRGKNKYAWYGTGRLQETLDALQQAARADGSFTTDAGVVVPAPPDGSSPMRIGDARPFGYHDSVRTEGLGEPMAAIASSAVIRAQQTNPASPGTTSPSKLAKPRRSATPSAAVNPDGVIIAETKSDSRKDKALGILSQRFVQLFLLNGVAPLSLEEAAACLLGGTVQTVHPNLLKTKVRRLYDVANILCSLRLIEKCTTNDRKPAFRWQGPNHDTLNPEMQPRKRPGMQGTKPPPPPPTTRKRKARGDAEESSSKKSGHDAVPVGSAGEAGEAGEAREEDNWVQLEQWKAAAGDAGSVVGSTSMECLESFDVEDYMRRAKQAGPEYFERAEKWLAVYNDWKSKPPNDSKSDQAEVSEEAVTGTQADLNRTSPTGSPPNSPPSTRSRRKF